MWVRTPNINMTHAPESRHVWATYYSKGNRPQRPTHVILSIGETHKNETWQPLEVARFQAGGQEYEYKCVRMIDYKDGALIETAMAYIPMADYQAMVGAGSISFQVGKVKDHIAYDWFVPLKMLLGTIPKE